MGETTTTAKVVITTTMVTTKTAVTTTAVTITAIIKVVTTTRAGTVTAAMPATTTTGTTIISIKCIRWFIPSQCPDVSRALLTKADRNVTLVKVEMSMTATAEVTRKCVVLTRVPVFSKSANKMVIL